MIFSLIKAEKNDRQADKINVKAFEKVATAEERKNQVEKDSRMSLEKLTNRKKGILVTSMKDFVVTYEKIMKIDLIESKELHSIGLLPNLIQDIRSMATIAIMKKKTPPANVISILGPIIEFTNSDLNLSAATLRRKQANVVDSQVETICIALEAIQKRADKISELLAKLNLLFRKSIETVKKIIISKGNNRSFYTREDKEQIMTCVNFATTIKTIIDTPLIDESGEMTLQSIKAIETGEEYLVKINNLLSDM
ncbi:hypothetical protein ACFQPF_06790 [Fictibacillus iocasae]|uniref:Uncharacterized protein n=1 Tax=Fictibacillus iocasae TaxID=2715437 RepID=A0ABW2NLR8_9BACL